MLKALAISLAVCAMYVGMGGSVSADNSGGGVAPDDNSAGAPDFRQRMRRRMEQGGLGQGQGARTEGPRMKEIMAIQSLSPDQKNKIQEIMRRSKDEMQPLMQQMREMRGQRRGGGTGGGPGGGPGGGGPGGGQGGGPGAGQSGGPGGHAQMHELVQQIRAKRQAAWEKVKPILNDSQMKELEQIRSGQGRPGGPVGGGQPQGGGWRAPGPDEGGPGPDQRGPGSEPDEE